MVSKISIVGVDDSVCPQDLVDLSQTFKFVEWGINLSPIVKQKPKYPSMEWIEELLQYSKYLNLRGILHGHWESDMLDGNCSLQEENPDLYNSLNYIQIDTRNSYKNIINVITLPKIILQINYITSLGSNILLPKSYISFLQKPDCGIIIEENDLGLLRIPSKNSFWVSIDGFRSSDDNVTLDLSKVEDFLNKAKHYVK